MKIKKVLVRFKEGTREMTPKAAKLAESHLGGSIVHELEKPFELKQPKGPGPIPLKKEFKPDVDLLAKVKVEETVIKPEVKKTVRNPLVDVTEVKKEKTTKVAPIITFDRDYNEVVTAKEPVKRKPSVKSKSTKK